MRLRATRSPVRRARESNAACRRKMRFWDAALERARALKARNPSILAVGIGFKHRTAHGYGAKPLPCLKFIVRRKRKTPARGRRIPKSIAVRRGRNVVRVRTDVEQIWKVVPHADRIVCGATGHPVLGVGSLGFFAKSAGGARFLVTAGHTFAQDRRVLHADDASEVPADIGTWAATPATCDEARATRVLDRAQIGVVDKSATYFPDVHGQLVDVALVAMAGEFPDRASVIPWSIPGPAIRALDSLRLAHAEGRFEAFTVFAASGQRRVRFDSLFGSEGSGMPVNDNPTYATPLIVYRTEQSSDLICGDSGAAVMTPDGREIIGLHVLGDGPRGFAVPAETALSEIKRVRNLTLSPTSV